MSSFMSQPRELLIEQLRHLKIDDLLRACSVNHDVEAICNERRLWEVKLIAEFNVDDFRRIPNPREYYLSLLKRRDQLFDFIISSMTRQEFDRRAGLFDDPLLDYNQFVMYQRDLLDKLDLNGLERLEFIRDNLGAERWAFHRGQGSLWMNRFFFYPRAGNLMAPDYTIHMYWLE